MVYSPHFSDVLFVIEAVNNRTRAEEKHCLEKGMSTDVKESELGLI